MLASTDARRFGSFYCAWFSVSLVRGVWCVPIASRLRGTAVHGSLASAKYLRVLVDFSFSTRDMDYGLEDKSIVYLLTLAFFFAAVKAFRCEW